MTPIPDPSPAATPTEGLPPFALPGDITIFGAAALKSQLSGWFATVSAHEGNSGDDDSPVLVDAGAVAEADAAGVQLLVAFSKSLAAHGRSLRIVNAGSLLDGACRTLGVGTLLMVDDNAGASR